MVKSSHVFIQTITDEEGNVKHQEEARDFLPCYEDLLFAAVCSGAAPNDGSLPPATIEPVWADSGASRVAGVSACLPPLSKQYDHAIFADRVLELLVEKGLVKELSEEGKKLAWHVEAKPREEERKKRFSSALSRQPYPLSQRPLSDFGVAQADGNGKPFSVFIAAALLEELRAETAKSLDRERADFLCGHLAQAEDGSIALVVTGRVPARVEESASQAHFAFSPLTFELAQQEIAGRDDGTTICGWHHNHPPTCGGDCLQTVPPCKTATVFFSAADRSVHRASFPAPYMIALVSGKESEQRADQPGVRAYGWQDALVREIEYSVF
jgi:hypothetical protein